MTVPLAAAILCGTVQKNLVIVLHFHVSIADGKDLEPQGPAFPKSPMHVSTGVGGPFSHGSIHSCVLVLHAESQVPICGNPLSAPTRTAHVVIQSFSTFPCGAQTALQSQP